MIKEGQFPEAIEIFKNIFVSIKNYDTYDEEVKVMMTKEYCACANNIALCYMQLHDHKQVIHWINIIDENAKVLESNLLVKAYLRRGLAYEGLDNIIKAREDFRIVKSYDLNNKQASDALHRLRPSKEELAEIQ